MGGLALPLMRTSKRLSPAELYAKWYARNCTAQAALGMWARSSRFGRTVIGLWLVAGIVFAVLVLWIIVN